MIERETSRLVLAADEMSVAAGIDECSRTDVVGGVC